MDFFSLPCTTCKTVLKVRSAAIVGKILACPKCGGMVLVKPPADWEPGKSGMPEGPSTITATPPSYSDDSFSKPNRDPVKDFEEIDHLLSGPRGSAPPPPPPQHHPQPASPSTKSSAPVAKEPASSKVNPAAPPVSPAAASASPNAPPAEKPLASKAPEKKTVAAAATIAPAVAAAAVPPPPPKPAFESSPIPPAPTSSLPLPPSDWSAERPWRHWLLVGASGVAGVLLAIGVVAFSIRMMRANREQPVISTVLPAPAVDEEIEPLEPTVDPSPPAPVEPSPVTEVKPVDPPRDPVFENPPAKPKPDDPLELTKPEEKPRPGRVFAGLDKFDAILNNSVKPETAPAEDPAAPPLPMDTPEKPLTSLPKPQPRKTNVAARLADPLPKIEADGVTLIDFLQLMSDLSTIPITLDPEGLGMAGAAPNTAVKFQASATTVGQALAMGLKSVNLVYSANEKGIVVSAPKDPRPISLPLVDLVAGDPAGPAVVLNLVTETITPGVWNETTGGPAITIKDDMGQVRHEPAVLWRVVDFTERLRVARGLPLKSKFDPKLFRQQTRTERVREKLATPVTLNFATPTPLTRVLDRLGRAAGMRLLVDWRSLDEVGWNPDGEALLAVEKAAFGEALDDLLSPMELTWRVIDDQTIQVLSQAALAAQPELEIHKLPADVADADSATRLISALRRELGEDAFQDHGGVCQLKYDAASKSLIAVLPQDKQRRLSAALNDPPAK